MDTRQADKKAIEIEESCGLSYEQIQNAYANAADTVSEKFTDEDSSEACEFWLKIFSATIDSYK